MAPFVGNPRQGLPKGLPFKLLDYLELLEWTGRQIHDDTRGSIPAAMPPILRRLNIKPAAWLQLTTQYETTFCQWIGHPESIHDACARLGQKWAKGASACKAAFSPGPALTVAENLSK